jgi:hypothetical protein
MTFKDWISYVIKRLDWYMETPKTERKQLKSAKRQTWSTRWFGLVPFATKMMLMRLKDRMPNRK